jgi:hypothetical protein
MPQKTQALIISKTKAQQKRKQLVAVIRKKRADLKSFILKNETLRVNLDMARQEYMVKVGSLFLKDNTLDLEIIRLRNISHLMDEGMTYDDAVEKLARTYYAEQLKFEEEKAKIKHEEEIFVKREEHKPLITTDLKKLWKKLISMFHPDLTRNVIEKKRRTEIMMQINRAYEEGDYEQLQKIEKEHAVPKETSIENLEEILLTLMREIEEQANIFNELQNSEWHDWMIKIEAAKKKKRDIFADTEKRLLDDIVAKLDLIKALKEEMQKKEKGLLLL